MTDLLLLHGAIGAKDQLEPLKERLASKYKVHTMSFSGHGKVAFNDAFNIAQFTNDVLDFLSANQLEKVDIVGYSMGGYVALNLAKTHPDKVGKIITLGTKFKWTPEIAAKEVKMLNPEVIQNKIPAFAQALANRHGAEVWKQLFAKTAQMMLEMGEHSPLVMDDYQTIQHVCKIMLADNDEMVTRKETEEVAEALPNATYSLLSHSKHPIEKIDLDCFTQEIFDTI